MPGQHQQLRRVDGAAAEDHLPPRRHRPLGALVAERNAGRALALQQDARAQRVGDDLQVGAAHRRAQERGGGRTPPPVARGHLVVADALLLGAVEVVGPRQAAGASRLDVGLAQRVALADVADRERPGAPVQGLVARPDAPLGAAEIGQHVVPRPSGVAELAPVVIVLGLAADIEQAVDGGGAAEHAPARPEHAPPMKLRLRLGLVAPVHPLVGDGLAVAERDVDPHVAVRPAGLQQHHAGGRVLRQPCGDDAAGRAGADDDVVGLDGVHSPLPEPA